MRTVRLRISYDGNRFYGWQRQEGFTSVQQVLEEALEDLTGTSATVYGAGRTDAGAHALGQTAHVHVDTRLVDERLLFAWNAHLPEGVVVRDLETCRSDFHAQKDARGKRYAYLIHTTRFRPALGAGFGHWTPHALDGAAMREAARVLVGEHDFTSFANAGSPRRSNVRRVHAIRIVGRRERVCIVVQGTGFLYNMVRTIAGTLLDAGLGRCTPKDVAAALEARDRKLAGPTLPAHGLCLLSVLYREPCFAPAGRRRGLF